MFRNLTWALGLLVLASLTSFAQSNPLDKRSDSQLEAVLDRYVGRWVGSYEIRTLTKEVVQRLDVEQQYWWDRDENGKRILKGQAVIASMGRITYSQSKTFIVKGVIYSETEQEGSVHLYAASISGDGNTLTWFAKDDDSFKAKKLADTYTQNSEGTFLTIEAFEQVDVGDGTPVMLVMAGKLKRVDDSVHSQTTTPGGDSPANNSAPPQPAF